MKKNIPIKGFRQPYIDETVDKPEPEETGSVEEQMVALIFDRFAPAASFPESTDQKTTLDLIDEMESSSDVSKNKVVMAMNVFGFKLHYSGSEYAWLLKER